MSIVQSRTRRRDPVERRTEIVEAASLIAVADGLESVTAKRVAKDVGVTPGLIGHYFSAADDLVAAAFGHAAAAERVLLFDAASRGVTASDRMKRLIAVYLEPDRDPVSLLWLDAWQASRRRPALLDEVVRQMEADTSRLAELIQQGIETGQFVAGNPTVAALRIMSLIDGLSIRAAIRGQIDYRAVCDLVATTVESELGLRSGELAN